VWMRKGSMIVRYSMRLLEWCALSFAFPDPK
jgi:hypothetical protein